MVSSANESGSSGDASSSELIGALEQGRRQFLQLVDHVRPELHRYCARMKTLPDLRPRLFRIAHDQAIDHWRHERRRASEPIEGALEPDNVMARGQAVRAALTGFLALAPAQRGCVILKDVLGHSIEEIATELDLSVPAVKTALHRGRAALREASEAPRSAPARRDVRYVRYIAIDASIDLATADQGHP